MELGVLCYIRSNNATLLLHRNKKEKDQMANFWIGLGGHVEIKKGEAPHESVIREVFEEAGIVVKPKFRGIAVFRNEEDEIDDWYAYIFTADEFEGDVKTSNEGTLKWIEDSKLKDINIPDGDRLFLQWLRETNQVFSAKFVYKQRRLLSHDVVFY